MRPRLSTVIPFLLLLVGPSLFGQQSIYIDAETGSNSTGDGSSGNPWRTVTYALTQLGGSGADLHLKGTNSINYDKNNGEVFPWSIKDGINLYAQPFLPGPNIIVDPQDTTVDAIVYDTTTPILSSTIDGLTIRNAAHGITATPAGLDFSVNVQDCVFDNLSAAAVRVAGSGGGLTDLDLTNCNLLSGPSLLYYQPAGGPSWSTIRLNSATSSATAIRITGTASSGTLTLSSNTVVSSGPGLVIDQYAGEVRVLGNDLDAGSTSSALAILNCPSWSQDSVVANNDCHDSKNGISVVGTTGVTLRNNTARLNANFGIRIDATSGSALLEGNRILDNTLAGLRVEDSSVVVVDNEIAGTTTGPGVEDLFVTDNLYTNNVIRNNSTEGVHLAAGTITSYPVLTHNTIVGNGGPA